MILAWSQSQWSAQTRCRTIEISGTCTRRETARVTKSLAKGDGFLASASGFLALPVQGALFDSVDETDHQDHHEPEHAAKDRPGIKSFDVVAVHYGPRIHENNFKLKWKKKNTIKEKLTANSW